MKNEEQKVPNAGKEEFSKKTFKRRTLLKSLVGIPVLGAFAYEALKKYNHDKQKNNKLNEALGIEDFKVKKVITPSSTKKEDMIRVGMIGFGNRALSNANGLGFMHPSDVEIYKKRGAWEDWLTQDPLNVALVGICDVFDLHAEKGLETASKGVRPTGAAPNLPVKRYRSYLEMLDDKNIDAVIISTPDHHHARMTIDAAKAGKHVYCEKGMALTEDEVNAVYNTVKNSKIVYQLGHQVAQGIVFQQAKEIIKRNILGKIALVETTTNRNTANEAWIRHLDANGKLKPGNEKTIDWDQWLGSTPKVPFSIERFYNWPLWFSYDTGLLGQLFAHDYDAVNQLLRIGIPKSVVASGGIYTWKDGRDMPDSFHVVFEYPHHDMTLFYSATLANSRWRGRVFMGRDASMELGDSIRITADDFSTRYKKQIEAGLINSSSPMISMNSDRGMVDAVSSATERYYIQRGLTTTNINGRRVETTYLHIKEWLDCIRNGGITTSNIELAYEEGMTCAMAQKSYIEERRVEWDPVSKKIV